VFLSRYVKGVPFFNVKYAKGVGEPANRNRGTTEQFVYVEYLFGRSYPFKPQSSDKHQISLHRINVLQHIHLTS